MSAGKPGDLAALTDDQLAMLILTPAMGVWVPEIGTARLAAVLMVAGIKLATDTAGEAGAWATARGIAEAAAERARRAAHPAPRPV